MDSLLRSEELVLLAVWQLAGEAYGVRIRHYLMDVTGEHFSYAAVYAPLDRLQRDGYIRAEDQPATAKRKGRRRRFFRPTAKGLAMLEAMRRVEQQLWQGFPALEGR